MGYKDFSYYGNVTDYGWVAFYDFFTRIGIIKHKEFNNFVSLLKTNVYDMIQLDGLCVVCELPQHVKRDDKGRLHSVTQPAILWRDGFHLNYIHGILFEEEEFENFRSGKITAKDIMQERNQDKKRVMAMEYGNEKLIKELNAKVCSEELDQEGNVMKIYSIPMVGETLVIYEGVDPAKNEKVYIRVPPEFESKTPYEAKCWTFPELWEAAQKSAEKLKFIEEA